MKHWWNCSDIKWSNLKGNNKYLIKRRKLIEIPDSFNLLLFLSLTRNYHTEADNMVYAVPHSGYDSDKTVNAQDQAWISVTNN